jgi:hypothetical protein
MKDSEMLRKAAALMDRNKNHCFMTALARVQADAGMANFDHTWQQAYVPPVLKKYVEAVLEDTGMSHEGIPVQRKVAYIYDNTDFMAPASGIFRLLADQAQIEEIYDEAAQVAKAFSDSATDPVCHAAPDGEGTSRVVPRGLSILARYVSLPSMFKPKEVDKISEPAW